MSTDPDMKQAGAGAGRVPTDLRAHTGGGAAERLPFRCWAEVDLDALRENLSWIRHRVGAHAQIMTVVKADAYGHGLRQIAAHLMRCGTDVFGVANLGEARAIRSVGKGWPVLMLGACLPAEVEWAVRDGVMATVSTAEEVRGFSREAVRQGRVARLHLKVDTGMGRLGALTENAVVVARTMGMPGVQLAGVLTHYSSAEDDAGFTRLQLQRFHGVLAALREGGINPGCVHAANSAGVLHESQDDFDLVRPGLLVYGVVPPGRRRAAGHGVGNFRPALALKARISLVREVPRGTTVSYGHTFTAPRRMRLAVVSAGYGDGYPRAGSGCAEVLVRGRRCPVVGRITMDQTVVDVTRMKQAVVGDEVVLVGRQGGEEVTASELAGWCGSIPWEILTGISYRVPRVYRGATAA